MGIQSVYLSETIFWACLPAAVEGECQLFQPGSGQQSCSAAGFSVRASAFAGAYRSRLWILVGGIGDGPGMALFVQPCDRGSGGAGEQGSVEGAPAVAGGHCGYDRNDIPYPEGRQNIYSYCSHQDGDREQCVQGSCQIREIIPGRSEIILDGR